MKVFITFIIKVFKVDIYNNKLIYLINKYKSIHNNIIKSKKLNDDKIYYFNNIKTLYIIYYTSHSILLILCQVKLKK